MAIGGVAAQGSIGCWETSALAKGAMGVDVVAGIASVAGVCRVIAESQHALLAVTAVVIG